MSTTPPLTPPSFRIAFGTQLDDQPRGVQQAHKTQWNAITDIYQSLFAVKSQLDEAKSSVASTAKTVENITSSSETIIVQPSTIGFVNNQTGATSYATQQSDYGAWIVLDDSSPIAVSLTTAPVISLPWFAILVNLGTGTATLTPATGTISYPGNLGASSMPLPSGDCALVVFDGTNFWGFTIPIPPQAIAAITSKWLNSYNSSTGLFTATQPTFTDISGTVAPSQLPTPTASTLGGVESAGPTTHEWINEIDTSGVPHLSQPAAADVIPASSTTGGRPTGVATGFMDFDTTLGIPIWWNGTAWVNASGTPV